MNNTPTETRNKVNWTLFYLLCSFSSKTNVIAYSASPEEEEGAKCTWKDGEVSIIWLLRTRASKEKVFRAGRVRNMSQKEAALTIESTYHPHTKWETVYTAPTLARWIVIAKTLIQCMYPAINPLALVAARSPVKRKEKFPSEYVVLMTKNVFELVNLDNEDHLRSVSTSNLWM
jgi:hypothetical protein